MLNPKSCPLIPVRRFSLPRRTRRARRWLVEGRSVGSDEIALGHSALEASRLGRSLALPESQILSIFNLQSSIFNLQSSIFNLQSSIFNLQSSIFNPKSCSAAQRAIRSDSPGWSEAMARVGGPTIKYPGPTARAFYSGAANGWAVGPLIGCEFATGWSR